MGRVRPAASVAGVGLHWIIDALLAGGLAGGLSGLAEALMMQVQGLGPKGLAPSLLFAAAASEISVPAGALVGLVVGLGRGAVPSGIWRGIDPRIAAGWIYGLGAALPFLAAVHFRLFLYLISQFRNLTLAALASSFLSIAAAMSAIGCAGFVASSVHRIARGQWARPVTALGVVALLWGLLAAPGLWAGPDEALRGPFGFVGLLRKDALDFTPPIVLAVLLGGLALEGFIRGLGSQAKAMAALVLVVCALAGLRTAASDDARPLILEHGVVSRISLRTMQRLGDRDHDGFSRWLGGGDCNDHDPSIHPGAREIRGNGIDEDCDGEDLPLAGAVSANEVRGPRPALPPKISFLILTVDALRPDLGFAGYRRPVSPNIDALAERSVVYEHAYSISTYTGFALPPLMASRYPSEMPRSDRHEVQYSSENTFLAERLRAAGYHTAGAASHFLFNPELGWIDGFERFQKTPLEGDAPRGSHVDLFHSSRGLADAAIKFLADPSIVSGPFFIWIHFLDPHKQYLDHPGFSNFGHTPRDKYDGEVAFTDYHIGRVLRALGSSPVADRTVVVITGDHGEAFGEHGAFFHGREVWDEIVRVPLVVYVPGARPRRIAHPVSHVDIAPTILDLAGAPEDSGARGRSLLTELFGGQLAARPILIDQPKNPYYPPKRAFIEGPYKLQHSIDSNAYRLFDIAHDPGETEDLAATQPDLLRKVRRSYSLFTSDIIEITPVPSVSGGSGEEQ